MEIKIGRHDYNLHRIMAKILYFSILKLLGTFLRQKKANSQAIQHKSSLHKVINIVSGCIAQLRNIKRRQKRAHLDTTELLSTP